MKQRKISPFLFWSNRFWLVLLILVLVSIIPVRLMIALYQVPVQQAIFVLGGDSARMEFAGEFWQSHTDLNVWVSDCRSNLDFDHKIFQRFGVSNQRLWLDGRATDTVTNFTTLVGDFVALRLRHIYLVTSDYHMRRARAIASIVLGSRGIVVTPVVVSSHLEKSESLVRVLLYCGRAILWILTGWSGAEFNPRLKMGNQ